MILDILLTGRTIAYNVKLALISGSVNAGLLLYQLCYWSDKGQYKNYFYKTLKEIEDELGLTRHEQDGAIKLLKSRKLIDVCLRGTPAKRFFSVNFQNIEQALRTLENTTSVQIAENRQTGLPKTGKLTAENRQSSLPKSGKHHKDDYKDDLREKREKAQKDDFEFFDEFVKSLCSFSNVKNPTAYAQKISKNLFKHHAATLQAYEDFAKAHKISSARLFVQSHYGSVGKRLFYKDDFFRIIDIFVCADSPHPIANVEPYFVSAMCQKDDSSKHLFTFKTDSNFLDFLQNQI